MTFERDKVVDGLCDNLEQWIGYEGYFADDVQALKNYVEKECDFSTFTQVEKSRNSGFFYFRDSNDDTYWLFYPANQPERKKLVPFDTCQELINWYCKREGLQLSKNQLPSIWVNLKKGYYEKGLISGFLDHGFVMIGGKTLSLITIFKNYMLLDGTPIGKEVKN